MDDSEDETTVTDVGSTNKSRQDNIKTSDKLLGNELRSFRNRGFHDGYDAGKKSTVQSAFDAGYQKAFELNFILSTLKGVAHALKSSSAATSSPSSSSSSSPKPPLLQQSTSTPGRRSVYQHQRATGLFGSPSKNNATNRLSPTRPSKSTSSSSTSTMSGGDTSNSSSSSNVSTTGSNLNVSASTTASSPTSTPTRTGNININISSNHLSLLESMKFDNASNIESIKNDLVKICRENRLEILAHYVSQIG